MLRKVMTKILVMTVDSEIEILLDKTLLDQGFEYYHKLHLNTASWLVFGPSGSGKSVFVKSIIGRLALYVPDSKVTICDGKADDYTFLRGIPDARYFEYTDMSKGLAQFYSSFQDRLTGKDRERTFRLIVLEEWGSYLRIMEELDKKAAKVSQAQLFSITSEGRAYNTHALLSVQRPDASLLTGFRENCTTVVGLGRISSEAARMVGFNEFDEFDGKESNQGVGWLLSEEGLRHVQVPKICNFEKLHRAIQMAVTR